MAARNLHAIQVLIPRMIGSQVGFFLEPDEKWSRALEKEVWSCPTHQTVRDEMAATLDGRSLEAYLDDVMQGVLGIPDNAYTLEVELPPAVVDRESPTTKLMTHYTLYPLVLWIDPAQLEPLRERKGGDWLTCEQALGDARVSETTREVFHLIRKREDEINKQQAAAKVAQTPPPPPTFHLSEPPRRLLAGVPEGPSMDALARKWRSRNRSGVSILDGATLNRILDAGNRAFNLRVADPYLRHQREGLGFTWSFFTDKDAQDLHVHGAPIVEIYGVLEGELEIWWKGYDERGSAAWSHRVVGPGGWVEVEPLECHVVHWLTEGKGVVFKAGPGPLAEVGRLGVKGKTPCEGCPCIKPPRVLELLQKLEEQKKGN